MQLNLTGAPIFTSQVFVVPTIGEAINCFISKQQQNFHTSIQLACFYELLNKHDRIAIKDMLSGLSVDDKIDLLHQECNIDFNDYPIHFRRGAAGYKIPKVVGDGTKNKWVVNPDLPIFTKGSNLSYTNIFKHGGDLFRQESLMKKCFEYPDKYGTIHYGRRRRPFYFLATLNFVLIIVRLAMGGI